MNLRPIIILYYHRVGSIDPVHLSIPKQLFEKQINFLLRNKYNFISLNDLYNIIIRSKPNLSKKYVVITFDDGFRDIYSNVYPILKKYGVKANVFLITDFIRNNFENSNISKTINNSSDSIDFYNSFVEAMKSNYFSFLSENEILEMADSGLVEFHSHTSSHRQIFCSTKITGLFPKTEIHWGIHSAYGMVLNENEPLPIFERCSGLLKPAYYPKLHLIKKFISNHLTCLKDYNFYKKKIFIELNKDLFDIEKEDEYNKRILLEIGKSIEICKKYNKENIFICWPWGHYNTRLIKMALRLGYIGTVTTNNGIVTCNQDIYCLPRFAIKKPYMLHFALGILLRSDSKLFKIYSLLGNKKYSLFL